MADFDAPAAVAEARAPEASFVAEYVIVPGTPVMELLASEPTFVAEILATEVSPGVPLVPLLAVDVLALLADHFSPAGVESLLTASDPSFEDAERDQSFDVDAAITSLITPQATFQMGVATPLVFRPSPAVMFLVPSQPDFVGGDMLEDAPPVFPFAWGDGDLIETYGHRTDLLTSFDGTEQRRQLRQVASGSLQFACPLLDAGEAQRAHAILFANQGRALVLPRWNYAQRIGEDAEAGGSEVVVPTASVPFAEGGFALLWRDSSDFELVIVLHVEPGRITTTQPLKRSWAAKTLILPCVVGRLGPDEALTWEARGKASSAIEFTIERWSP